MIMAEQKEHVAPPRLYLKVLLGLLALLVITIVMAFIDIDGWTHAHHLGAGWNTGIALTIAVLKGLLILMFFMHIKYSTRLTKMIVGCGIFWLILLLFIVMADIWTRSWMGVPGR